MDTAPTARTSLLIRLHDSADDRAWTEFAAVYGPLGRRLLRSRGLQNADAEDLGHDVFEDSLSNFSSTGHSR